ncbi:MAG: RNA methyltransferase [Clostridia bacterium]|nr:RNA methyltransferase [Clostridia bacterium]
MNVSEHNKNIVLAKKLLQKKYRDLENKYLVEGAKLVKEALQRNQEINYIVVREDSVERYSDILLQAKYFVVSSKVMQDLVDTVTNQGILAVVNKPTMNVRAPLSNALVLEHVQDPTNVGAILRTAAALGYNDVYMIQCADPYSPKCIRAGMSSQFCLNIFEGNPDEILSFVKQTCLLICADMDGKNIYSCNVSERHAILFGNEGNGVSDFLKQNCDMTVAIPMQNQMESLNVSVSAGILMYSLSSKQMN